MRRFLRPPGLGGDKLRIERVGEPGDNLVLHVEQIGDGLLETIRPEVSPAFRID